ncbi:hypothetical protein DYADSP32_3880, partial [Dyadobacter sp. 32]
NGNVQQFIQKTGPTKIPLHRWVVLPVYDCVPVHFIPLFQV